MSPHIQLWKEGHRCKLLEFRGPGSLVDMTAGRRMGVSVGNLGQGLQGLVGEPECFGEGWVVCRERRHQF